MKSTLITGGARSGKSKLAQEMAKKNGGPVLFVATAEALDDEMKQRIDAHRRNRPGNWTTLEVNANIGQRIGKEIGRAKTVIIDDITLLVNNIVERQPGKIEADRLEKEVTAEIEELIACMRNSQAEFIIVTNEVGLGIVPADKISRLYRDLLGRANQMLAKYADEVLFMVAGIPLKIK